MTTPQQAFNDAAERLSALALKLKMHFEEERDGEAREAMRDAFNRFGAAIEDAVKAVGDAAKDDAVRTDAKEAARSVGDALATVFSQVGSEIRAALEPKDKTPPAE